MKLFSKIFITFFAVVTFSVAANAQKEWLGGYVYDEDGGKTAGGSAVFISHQIDVVESDDGMIATIQSTGYQTSRDLVCTTKVEGTKLLIYFDSYGENNIFEPYEKGDLLLTLERKTLKGKTEILTHWGKFQPVVPKKEKPARTIYFIKNKEN